MERCDCATCVAGFFSSQRRMVMHVGLWTSKHSTKLSKASATLFPRSMKFSHDMKVTSSCQNLISPCSVALLSWMKTARTSALLQTLGICSVIHGHLWASLLHPTLHRRLWNTCLCCLLKTLKCTLMMLLPFWMIGILILAFLKKCLPCCRRKVSWSTLQNANGVSKRPFFLDNGSHQKVSSSDARRLMQSCA